MSSTTVDILDGVEDLTEWSDEELERGVRKKNGKFPKSPRVVPTEIQMELRRRQLSRSQTVLDNALVKCVTALTEIATDELEDASVRIRAIAMVMDRVMGTSPQHVELSVKPAWASVLEGAIVTDENLVLTEGGEEDNAIEATAK